MFVEMKRLELRGRKEHLGSRGLGSICGEQGSQLRFRGRAGSERVRQRHHRGGGQLDPGGPGSAGGWGRKRAPSFLKRRLPHSDSSGNDLELLQNGLITLLFSRPFCIVWIFFKMSMGSFESENKQLSYFHLQDCFPPLHHIHKRQLK